MRGLFLGLHLVSGWVEWAMAEGRGGRRTFDLPNGPSPDSAESLFTHYKAWFINC